MDPRIDEVLTFWFRDPARWFAKNPVFDDQIRERFGALRDQAAAGGLASWRSSAKGELALIILLDQFSRNMFRGNARAFETDATALGIARGMRASGRARQLTPLQQVVMLLPFQHAEDLDTQAESVAAYQEILDAAPAEERAMFENNLSYAKQHHDIIEKFGRFPHRNAALGRTSTADERAFLAQPGSSF